MVNSSKQSCVSFDMTVQICMIELVTLNSKGQARFVSHHCIARDQLMITRTSRYGTFSLLLFISKLNFYGPRVNFFKNPLVIS